MGGIKGKRGKTRSKKTDEQWMKDKQRIMKKASIKYRKKFAL